MNQAVYDRLKAVASARDLITYEDVAPLANLDMADPDHRNQMSRILEAIARAEFAQGNPLLTVVVVHKHDYRPGHGFFVLARELGLYGGSDDVEYFSRELKRVHDHWKKV